MMLWMSAWCWWQGEKGAVGELGAMDEEANRLYRIRRTVMQMLRDRGYLVGDFEINMTKAQFVDKFGESVKRDSLVINKAKRNESSDQVLHQCPRNFFSYVDSVIIVVVVHQLMSCLDGLTIMVISFIY